MTDPLPPEPDRDADDWLNLLAGRAAPDADPRTRQEAEMLRQVTLERRDRPLDELSDADLSRGRERLLFQLRREAPPAPARPWWRQPALLAGLAAGLAGITIAPLLWSPDRPAPETVPGMEPPPRSKPFRLPVVVRADPPAAAARALAEALAGLGIAAQPVQQAESWFIDVQLPDPPPVGLAALLARHGLRPPLDRRLLVEFVPKPAESPR
ncbi:MAG: hypothetical protein P9F75_07070 [Candidatus Contendobacter sp.]|nr:hypothetical protein [Candidatus Contendobacter sp.]